MRFRSPGLALVLTLCACAAESGDGDGDLGGASGGGGEGAQSNTGGQSAGAGGAGGGSAAGASDGVSGGGAAGAMSGGAMSGGSGGGDSGGASGSGGGTGAGGDGGESTGGLGGTGVSNGGDAGESAGGAAAAGASNGGDGGDAVGGDGGQAVGGDGGESTGGAGGASGTECTRELLDGLLDDYFAALGAGDPSSLPLSASVKFTENAQEAEIGTTEFWMNAGDAKYSQRALDVEQCSVAAQAVVPENGMDLPIALRIKVEEGEMSEIETIVVRPGDYTASYAVDSNPGAIISIADEIGWHEEVPEGQRATREELLSWIDKYFRAFPSGVCDVTGACTRLENGGGSFSCGGAASCSAGDPGPESTFIPRVIIADEVRGIAAGITIFDYMATGHLDMHMVKMSGGQVHAVQAILRDTNGQSGWD